MGLQRLRGRNRRFGIQSYLAKGVADTRAALLEDQNPATFAAVLLPAFVFGLYEMLNGERRIAGGAITALTAAGILVSGRAGHGSLSRSWWSSWAAPTASTATSCCGRRDGSSSWRSLYQLPGVPDLLAERTGTAVETGGAGRTDIWSVAGTIYASAPVLGVGFANFPVAYTPEVVRAADVTRLLYPGELRTTPSYGTLIELGPIGLILVALAFGPLVVRRGWGPDAAPIQAALASMLTLALFLDMLTHRKQVYLVLGLAAGLAYLARQVREAAAKEDGQRDDASGVLPKGNGPTGHLPYVNTRPMTDALWIVHAYPWRDQPAGGVFFQTQAEALARRGLDLVVAIPTPWAPWPLARLRKRWARYASAPAIAKENSVTAIRPRYANLPGEPSWASPDR